MFDFALAAISATCLAIPEFAALQAWAKPNKRARVITANNILNSTIMVIGAAIIIFAQYLGTSFDMILQKFGGFVPFLNTSMLFLWILQIRSQTAIL